MSFTIDIFGLSEFFRALPVSPPLSVLVAVSGGADSVALLHLLRERGERLGIGRLAAAHVNHGLRGEESDGDEAFVRAIAGGLGVDVYCTRLDKFSEDGWPAGEGVVRVPFDSVKMSGIEEWARHRRYGFFAEIAENHGFNYVATAHTANDQAETVLMRLIRGTGVRGLRGIHPVRGDGVIRPLLNVERHQLEAWLKDRGLAYRVDSSNADDGFRRNYVRNRIIPLIVSANPAAVQNMASCAASAARAWDVIAGNVHAWIDRYVPWRSADAFHIEKAGFSDTLTAPEALITLFDEYAITPSRLHISRIMSAVSLTYGEHLLPDNWKFYPREDRLCFIRALQS